MKKEMVVRIRVQSLTNTEEVELSRITFHDWTGARFLKGKTRKEKPKTRDQITPRKSSSSSSKLPKEDNRKTDLCSGFRFEMECSEARLETIESQRSTVLFHDQRRQRNFPMNLINKATSRFSSRSSSQSGGEGTLPSKGDTESVPEFLTNLRLLDLFNLPGGCVQMNPETFCGVSNGNKECLQKLRSHEVACLKSHSGDSVLHLAATWGHLELVKSIVSEYPCLILVPNSKDQLPLHVAVYAGHSAVVEALVATLTFVSAKLSEEEKERLNLYVVKDKDGDTPLHLALKGRYMEIASSLVKASNQASFLANNEGISPLYMAVETGDLSLVKAILNTTGDNGGLEGKECNLESKLEGRKHIAHAALKAKSTDILNVILKEYPSLEDEPDEEGRTCLSFGASIGYYEGVCNLLDRSTKNVYVCDDDGSFPIHLAIEKCSREKCSKKIVDEFLERCPDSKHLLNKRGQNILHIAAKMGKHIINYDVREILSFGQDVDGNTPLHLATKNWCSELIPLLALGERILQLRNNNGLRALDIAVLEMKPYQIFHERLTLALLVAATERRRGYERQRSITKPSDPLNHDKDTAYVNTFLLVAALVATMTFAAGFTIPGGLNSSNPHLGRAALATNPTFLFFLLFDTLALVSSVATIAILIWAQVGDPALIRASLDAAVPLMFYALLFMPLAFFFGVITAVGHVKWLVAIASIMSFFFFYWVYFLIGPHVLLQMPISNSAIIELLMKFRGLFPNMPDGTHLRKVDSVESSGTDGVKKLGRS